MRTVEVLRQPWYRRLSARAKGQKLGIIVLQNCSIQALSRGTLLASIKGHPIICIDCRFVVESED